MEDACTLRARWVRTHSERRILVMEGVGTRLHMLQPEVSSYCSHFLESEQTLEPLVNLSIDAIFAS